MVGNKQLNAIVSHFDNNENEMNKILKTFKCYIHGVHVATEFWEETPEGKLEYYYKPCAGFTTRDKIKINKPSTLEKEEI